MKPVEIAQVHLWGRKIGTLIWQNNLGSFTYDRDFQRSGIQLAPITMPLSDQVYAFNTLNPETFKRLPGLLADSLPDKFGNQLIDQWLEMQGRTAESFSPLERLCYIGSRGMGALEFEPAIGDIPPYSQTVNMAELVNLANEALGARHKLKTEFGNTDTATSKALESIISVGTSAGGARAKAVIAWNEHTNEVRSGQVTTEPGFSYWLLKFDGINENKDKEQLADPKGFGLLEYAYYLMAQDAGINMTRCRLLRENGRAHFMTERFDRRENGEKLHMLTLCGMAHYDFNQAGAYSYEQALGIMRDLQLPHGDFISLYRRMLFNVMARNQDDHTKNIAFLMDKSGTWRLSPAYDLTYSNGQYWTSRHQMTINGKRDNFTKQDLIAVASHADLRPAQAQKLFDEVLSSVKKWPEFASRAQLPEGAPRSPKAEANWTQAIHQQMRLQW